MEEYNADFDALQALEQDKAAFTAEEVDELRALLGLYGLGLDERLPTGASVATVEDRQQHWRDVAQRSRVTAGRTVAERAVERLGLLLDELEGHSGD